MRSLRRISDSTTEPVSVAELRDHLRILSTSEDSMLSVLLQAARNLAETKTGRALTVQTWEMTLDAFPGDEEEIKLPRAPLSTSSSDVVVSYVEDTTAGNTTQMASTALTVDARSEPGRIFPSYDNDWPDDCRDEFGAVRIQYVCGYPTPASVPEPIKTWIKMRAGFFYENRESAAVGPGGFINLFPRDFVDGLLDEYVLPEVY